MTDGQSNRAASANEIRDPLGELKDNVITRILAPGATADEILEAKTWLATAEELQRQRHHPMQRRVAAVFTILEAELPEANRR